MHIVLPVVLVLLVLVVLAMSIVLVRPQQAAVLERRGQFSRVAEQGVTVTVPFVERVRARVDLREQVLVYAPQTVQATDGELTVTPTLRYQVADPRAAVYRVPNHVFAVEEEGKRALRAAVGRMTRAEATSSRIAQELTWRLAQEADRWGVRVTSVDAAVR